LVGILSSFSAVLTLPGIAGIVLTMGMAVDANVLIYERIREERRAGKGLRKAIEDGFGNAISAIIDSNVTSFLTGAILAIFGTGPIKGFAVTYMIGIVSSFLTAVFICRLLLEAYAKKDEEPKKTEDDEEKCPECGKPVSECECDHEDDEDKKKKYSLEEIPEYVELQARFAALEAELADAKARNEQLETEMAPLAQFKKESEKKDKEAMINSFYMLSDEDKADVITNIDTYSLEDIEAKLSIICVRNRVSFNSDDDTKPNTPVTFNLDGAAGEDASTPAWVKAALKVAKSIN
jgi:preprotein translocase subunit SecD